LGLSAAGRNPVCGVAPVLSSSPALVFDQRGAGGCKPFGLWENSSIRAFEINWSAFVLDANKWTLVFFLPLSKVSLLESRLLPQKSAKNAKEGIKYRETNNLCRARTAAPPFLIFVFFAFLRGYSSLHLWRLYLLFQN
jgi:hypothetical protein